ncbi:MAG: O-antigen ligase family protein [Elusimicrobia bacterium]|nr:O-antigen ligase family protein [Elusimicrobiota bacterium]
MLLWGLHLGYPAPRLQAARWIFLGRLVPIYYFFTVALMLGTAATALALKRGWRKWELLWWALPLICLPGILGSDDLPWSLRQWFSWIIRGVIPGGVIFFSAHRKIKDIALLCWIYPVVIAASVLGLREIYTNRNPLWDRFDFEQQIPATSQTANPFYRPHDAIATYITPRGTQGNRIPYASTLVGFLPLGLWVSKYRKSLYWVNILAVVVLLSILVMSQARSAWMGTLAAVVLMRIFGLQKNSRETIKFAAGMLLCLAVFLAWQRTQPLLWSRLNSFHLTEESIRQRLAVLQTVKVLKDHWLIGIGFGQFPTVCRPYYPAALPWQSTPDNQYLRWLIENGLLGFSLLMAFFIGIVRAGWEKIKRLKDAEQADYYKSILVGWLSVAVTFIFFDGFYWGACNMTFWCLLGLFAVCLRSPETAA